MKQRLLAILDIVEEGRTPTRKVPLRRFDEQHVRTELGQHRTSELATVVAKIKHSVRRERHVDAPLVGSVEAASTPIPTQGS